MIRQESDIRLRIDVLKTRAAELTQELIAAEERHDQETAIEKMSHLRLLVVRMKELKWTLHEDRHGMPPAGGAEATPAAANSEVAS